MKEKQYLNCGVCGELFQQKTVNNLFCTNPECKKQRTKQRWAKWREKDGSDERVLEYQRRFRKKTHYGKKWEIKKKYGLEWDEYLELLERFNHSCALCGATEDLCIDHDHLTGKIRGILCRPHNMAIGALGDDYDSVQRAAEYLKEFS